MIGSHVGKIKDSNIHILHIWILLLNSLHFLYIDFYNGEIGYPTPKRFNSPTNQNHFLFVWKNSQWYLIPRHNFIQSTLNLLTVSKDFFLKSNNWTQILNFGLQRPRLPAKKTTRFQKFPGVHPSRKSGCDRGTGVLIFLLKDFFQNSWFCPQA